PPAPPPWSTSHRPRLRVRVRARARTRARSIHGRNRTAVGHRLRTTPFGRNPGVADPLTAAAADPDHPSRVSRPDPGVRVSYKSGGRAEYETARPCAVSPVSARVAPRR